MVATEAAVSRRRGVDVAAHALRRDPVRRGQAEIVGICRSRKPSQRRQAKQMACAVPGRDGPRRRVVVEDVAFGKGGLEERTVLRRPHRDRQVLQARGAPSRLLPPIVPGIGPCACAPQLQRLALFEHVLP